MAYAEDPVYGRDKSISFIWVLAAIDLFTAIILKKASEVLPGAPIPFLCRVTRLEDKFIR